MRKTLLFALMALAMSFASIWEVSAQTKDYKDDFTAGQVLPFDTASVNQYIKDGWVSWKFQNTPLYWTYGDNYYYQIYNYANGQNDTIRIKNVSNITISVRCVNKTGVSALSPIYVNGKSVAGSSSYQWSSNASHDFTFDIPTPDDVSTIIVNGSNNSSRFIVTQMKVNSVAKADTVKKDSTKTEPDLPEGITPRDQFYSGEVLWLDTANVNKIVRDGWGQQQGTVTAGFQKKVAYNPITNRNDSCLTGIYYPVFGWKAGQLTRLYVKNVKKMTVYGYCYNVNNTRIFQVSVNGNTVVKHTASAVGSFNDSFELDPDKVDTIEIFGNTGSASNRGLVPYAIKIDESAALQVTIPEGYKRTAFSAGKAIDFSKTDGIKAYVVTDNEGHVAEITKAPANTGVIVEGKPGIYFLYEDTTATASAKSFAPTAIESNKLVAVNGDNLSDVVQLKEGQALYYYTKNNDKEGFYPCLATPSLTADNTALLKLTDATLTPAFIPFGGGAQADPATANGARNPRAYYKRPKGAFYAAWAPDGEAYDNLIVFPTRVKVTYKNASDNPGNTTWEWNRSGEAITPDEGTNDVTTSISLGYGTYNVPQLINGTDTFSIASSAWVPWATSATGLGAVNFNQVYYGDKDGKPLFGNAQVTNGGKTYSQTSWYEVFDKPLTVLSLDAIYFYVWAKGTDIKDVCKNLNVGIYNVKTTSGANGESFKTPGDSLIATLTFSEGNVKVDNSWSTIGGEGSTNGIATFSTPEVTLTDEFAIVVSGYEGKDMGFYFGKAPDYFVKSVNADGTNVYDECISPVAHAVYTNGSENIDRTFASAYYPVMSIHGFQDNVYFFEYLPYSKSNLTDLTAPMAGGQVTSTDNQNPAELFIGNTWSTSNYKFDINYFGQSPWINQHENGSDADKKMNVVQMRSYVLLRFYADMIPDNVEGRHAIVRAVGKGGIKSNPIIIRQGDDNTTLEEALAEEQEATGISTIENAKSMVQSAGMYNLAGQKVSKDYKGIVIRNGRKLIQK